MNKANSIINIFLLAGDKFMLEWSGYFFKEMVNILDIQPEHFLINDFEGYKDGSTILNVCCEENSVPMLCLTTQNVFPEKVVFLVI